MAFVNTAIVALRESLEAFLIIGILAGILRKAGHPEGRRWIVVGATGGLAASLLLGWAAQGLVEDLYSRNAPWFEAGTSLLAVAVVVYMAIWMYRHTRELMGTLHRQTRAALALQRPAMLFWLSALAVLREGAETVLFTAQSLPIDGAAPTLLAVALGVALSALLAFLVFSGMVRLSIERFMSATGLVLIVVAAGMLVYGLHELSETQALHGLKDVPFAYDLRDVLPSNGYGNNSPIDTPVEALGAFLAGAIGYRDRPTWLEVGAWLGFLGIMVAWWQRARRHHALAQVEPPQAPPG